MTRRQNDRQHTTRVMLASAAAGAVVAWWLATSPASPVSPTPDRPVLTAMGRLVRLAARLGLFVAMAAEKPPQHAHDQKLAQAPRVDARGQPIVDHTEGW